jgi:diguanylate cyclase (GGDEF)-like protein
MAGPQFDTATRTKYWQFLEGEFPPARVAYSTARRRLRVGGEKQARLEQRLREKMGRLDFDGDTVQDKLKGFVFAATPNQLFFMLGLMVEVEAEFHRDAQRAAEAQDQLSSRVDSWLLEVGLATSLETALPKTKGSSIVDCLMEQARHPLDGVFGEKERIAVWYLVEQEFPPGPNSWMGGTGVSAGHRELEERLRKALRSLQLAKGHSADEILRNFIIGRATPDELILLLQEVPAVGARWFKDDLRSKADAAAYAPSAQQRVVDLLENFGLQMVFSDGVLEQSTVDKSARKLKDLPNREQLTSRLRRLKDRNDLTSVVFIDLDNFKQVNDRISHEAGNNCLDTTADVIGAVIRDRGALYRYGGDEFAALLPNFETHEAVAVAERIRREIEATNPGKPVVVTASIGVACTDDGSDAVAIIHAADQASFASKCLGKNRVTAWPLDPETAATVRTGRENAKGR